MTVINIGDGVFTGLTTDNKPWPSDDNRGFRYLEFAPDYSKFITWLCDGVRWVPQTEFPETLLNKTIDLSLNNVIDSTIVYNDQNNNLGAHYFDMETIATPADPAVDHIRFYVKAIDANNDGLFVRVKKAGVYTDLQVF